MKERPILFSAPMVRALLAGTKTQTRRPLKQVQIRSEAMPEPEWRSVHTLCPYGQPGDRLWVRETWRTERHFDHLPPRDLDPALTATPVQYEAGPHADVLDGKLRPGMFMPRWASRITLEVTGVRVERLQDISEADAIAEGVHADPRCRQDDDTPGFHRIGPVRDGSFPIARYGALWESLNGLGSWKSNPWVWVLQFRRI